MIRLNGDRNHLEELCSVIASLYLSERSGPEEGFK